MLSCFSLVQLFVTLRTIAHQAPLSMGFSRQEYWSGWPCPPLEDLSYPGVKPKSLKSPALAGRFFTTVPPGKPPTITDTFRNWGKGLPWWSSGYDSVPPVQGVWVQSLVKELDPT